MTSTDDFASDARDDLIEFQFGRLNSNFETEAGKKPLEKSAPILLRQHRLYE